MARRRLFAEPVGPTEFYFSAAKFRAWTRRRFGARDTLAALSRRTGLPIETVRSLRYNRRQPYLNTYCRLVAALDAPFDAFLEHVDYRGPNPAGPGSTTTRG